ncbi:ROK family transcriptional regulator [Brachybacterium sacelli]|uniref:NBD/HSP70 family sugar kinase n=1 Tax=Brachybacterium sacelli TaxID=173364 RepID=A0ABS4WVA4_9MICO|nr:ROK family protein [Brachybacterium sacelli]MBP2380130.1 putative NBD/HSP70 family sugar kinase [Brachybacterium sacelli]
MSTTGSHQAPASAREREVIEAFRAGGVLTRARIAETTGLGRSTVSAVLTRLTDEGAIAVVGHDEQDGRGRPTERLAVDPDAVRAIGIDLAHGAVRVVTLNILGETLAQEERAHEDALGGGPRHRIVHELLDGLDLPERTPALRGIGLGVSGPISLTRPERAPWRALVADLTARHGFPVQVDNTTRFAAFAEHLASAEDGRTTLHVRCYQGVGGAVVREGALDLGATGMAGEVGHLPVEEPGMTCRCGRSGCLETVASTPAVLAALRTHGIVLRSPSELPGALVAHPKALRPVLDRVARSIARALVLTTTLVDPDEVILTGDLFDTDDHLLDAVRPLVAEGVGERFPLVPLARGRLDAFAGAVGAALVVLSPRGRATQG